jgi:hypothetical protein
MEELAFALSLLGRSGFEFVDVLGSMGSSVRLK